MLRLALLQRLTCYLRDSLRIPASSTQSEDPALRTSLARCHCIEEVLNFALQFQSSNRPSTHTATCVRVPPVKETGSVCNNKSTVPLRVAISPEKVSALASAHPSKHGATAIAYNICPSDSSAPRLGPFVSPDQFVTELATKLAARRIVRKRSFRCFDGRGAGRKTHSHGRPELHYNCVRSPIVHC